jgi:hypothetical protein
MTIQGNHGGLQDSRKAFVYLQIRSQGPAQSGQAKTNQLTTFTNACSFRSFDILDPLARIPVEVGECAFIYDSQHLPPE